MFEDATEDTQSKLTFKIAYCIFLQAFSTETYFACHIFNDLREELYSDLRQTIAMTTTAMIKTKLAVMEPTMSGNCSCHDFGGSAIRIKERQWFKKDKREIKSCIFNQYKLNQSVILFRDWCFV